MGSSKPINSVDFKPTRPFRAVVASEDNSICYFEGPPFKWKNTLSVHDRFVNVVRYAPNGDKFASGGADGKLVIFDGKLGDKLYEITVQDGPKETAAHKGSIYSLCWDPTSKFILTASGDKTAKVWNVEEKRLVKEVKFGEQLDDQQVGCLWQNDFVLTVSLSGCINYLNSAKILNGSGDASVVDRVVKGHSKSITALEIVNKASSFSGNEPLIISASHDGLIIYWNSANGKMDSIKASNIGQHKNQVQSIRYDSGSNQLVTCGLDDTVKFIDLDEFKYR